MQEDESLEETGARTAPVVQDVDVAQHRAPRRLGRPLPYVAAALVAAVGLGVAGISAATTRDGGHDPVSVTAADRQARSENAARADRSERDGHPDATPDGRTASPEQPSTEPDASPASPDASATSPDGSPASSASPEPNSQPTPRASDATPPADPAEPAQTATPAQRAAAPAVAPDWVHPMPGAAVTSCYGMRWGVLHAGIDLAMPSGTPIHAVAAGTVIESGWVYAGYGISVVVDHGNGYLTHYAHQSSTAVGVGQRVTAGQVIGYEGSTGDSTGPHLHFEVHNGLWNQLDPAPWMRERGVDLGC